MTGPGLLICGSSQLHRRVRAVAPDLQAEAVTSPAEAAARLQTSSPSCVLVDCAPAAAEELCARLRHVPSLSDLPLVAAVEDPWSGEVSRAFSLGVDDYVPVSSLEQLSSKLDAIRRSQAAAREQAARGQLVVIDPDAERRQFLGWHLRRVGLHLSLVEDWRIPSDIDTRLVVAHGSLVPSRVAEGLKRRRQSPRRATPLVLIGTSYELSTLRSALHGQPGIGFWELGGDPAQLAFLANALQFEGRASRRRSERVRFNTPIHVRQPEGQPDLWGFTYNMNLTGLYVRTLTPPQSGAELTMELHPPGKKRRASVPGKVVWRTEYAPGAGHPPGFGVQYAAGVPEPVVSGYRELVEQERQIWA